MESELFEICAQLQRDAGCKKVMVCGQEGEVLAHAGERGSLGEAASDILASIVVDAMHAATATAEGAARPAELQGELQAALGNSLTACATALAGRAVLVVVFDESTTVERVRVKMRRARDRLVKSLPGTGDPTESTPSKS